MKSVPWKREREIGNGGRATEAPLARLRQDMETLFDRFLREPWGGGEGLAAPSDWATFPRTDLAESENDITVSMELPGVDAKDVDINITQGLLTVGGEKRQERDEKTRNYRCVEREYGRFHRSVQLPGYVDPDKVDAAFKDGVLTVKVAKHPEAKPKRIPVNAGG